MALLHKRLDLIKNLIALEEIDLLDAQVGQLREMDISNEMRGLIDDIAACLEEGEYARAVDNIEAVLSGRAAVQRYEDPRIAGLRLEARKLEEMLGEFEGQKAEIEREIHSFNLRHQQELGPIIKEILHLQKQEKQQAAEGAPDDEEAQADYERARRKYEEYYSFVNEALAEERIELTEDEQAELKRLHRKASKKCHPDVVVEVAKEDAQVLFVELQEAYERSDLDAMRSVVERIERGVLTSRSEQAKTMELLEAEVERLNHRIRALREEINALQASEEYQTLINIQDLDEYFTSRKRQLRDRLDDLRKTTAAA